MKELLNKSVDEIVQFLNSWAGGVPATAVVLGSGVEALQNLSEERSLPYGEVFGLSPTVPGHAGSLSVGRLGDRLVAVLRGRFHLYEGLDWDVVTLPARVLANWGVAEVYLTNAAGGVNLQYHIGDFMVLTGYRDHLHPRWRDSGLLPALSKPNTPCENALTDRLWQVGNSLRQSVPGLVMQRGVYAGLLGPNYETLAEIQMLRRLGCDAVGMSTVPELETLAKTASKAAALSVITNIWREDTGVEGHKEVLRETKAASQRLDQLLRAVIS